MNAFLGTVVVVLLIVILCATSIQLERHKRWNSKVYVGRVESTDIKPTTYFGATYDTFIHTDQGTFVVHGTPPIKPNARIWRSGDRIFIEGGSKRGHYIGG